MFANQTSDNRCPKRSKSIPTRLDKATNSTVKSNDCFSGHRHAVIAAATAYKTANARPIERSNSAHQPSYGRRRSTDTRASEGIHFQKTLLKVKSSPALRYPKSLKQNICNISRESRGPRSSTSQASHSNLKRSSITSPSEIEEESNDKNFCTGSTAPNLASKTSNQDHVKKRSGSTSFSETAFKDEQPSRHFVDGTFEVPRTQRRSFSSSVKWKIKKILLKVSSTSPTNVPKLPKQHIEASRAYYASTKSYMNEDALNPKVFGSIIHECFNEEASQELHESLTEEPHLISSNIFESDAGTTRSRVTSWTNSMTSNTISEPRFEHLSPIKESVGDGPQLLVSHETNYFAPKATKKNAMSKKLGLKTYSVDPRRVYSALLKRLDVNEKKTKDDDQDVSIARAVSDTHEPAQRISSSLVSIGASLTNKLPSARTTIRTVTPDSQASYTSIVSIKGRIRIPRPTDDSSSSDDPSRPLETARRDAELIRSQYQESELQGNERANIPNAELIERRVRKAEERWKSPLDAYQDPFLKYMPESAYHLNNSISPAGKYSFQDTITKDGEEQIGRVDTTPKLRASSIDFRKYLVSPSIYSCDSNGNAISPKSTAGSDDVDLSQIGKRGGGPDIQNTRQSRPPGSRKDWFGKEDADYDYIMRELKTRQSWDVSNSNHEGQSHLLVNKRSNRVYQASQMNERFPFLDTKRVSSALSFSKTEKHTSLKPKLSENFISNKLSQRNPIKGQMKDSLSETSTQPMRPSITTIESKTVQDNEVERLCASQKLHTIPAQENIYYPRSDFMKKYTLQNPENSLDSKSRSYDKDDNPTSSHSKSLINGSELFL